jgi:NAD(P)-dependent dehydrogenase (short-subunit alcohol dehydrogenase family)
VATNNAIGYCTSKAATDMLTKCFSAEFAPHGITVNAIAPTVFRSALTAWLFEMDKEWHRYWLAPSLE